MAVIWGTPIPATIRVVQIEPGTDADLDGVDAGLDEGLGPFEGGHIAGDELAGGEIRLRVADGIQHSPGVSVGCVDADHVTACVQRAPGPGLPGP